MSHQILEGQLLDGIFEKGWIIAKDVGLLLCCEFWYFHLQLIRYTVLRYAKSAEP